MSYYDEYDEYEEYDAVAEEARENTETSIQGQMLEIKFDMKSFSKGIVEQVRHEVVHNLNETVMEAIKNEIITDNVRQTVMLAAHEIVKEMIDDYVAHEKITIGGNSFWDDEPLKEYSMQEYAKKCIADSIKDGKFRVVTEYKKDRYGRSLYELTEAWR